MYRSCNVKYQVLLLQKNASSKLAIKHEVNLVNVMQNIVKVGEERKLT